MASIAASNTVKTWQRSGWQWRKNSNTYYHNFGLPPFYSWSTRCKLRQQNINLLDKKFQLCLQLIFCQHTASKQWLKIYSSTLPLITKISKKNLSVNFFFHQYSFVRYIYELNQFDLNSSCWFHKVSASLHFLHLLLRTLKVKKNGVKFLLFTVHRTVFFKPP